MSDELFGELMQSLDQALRHSRGEQINARTTVLPIQPQPLSRQRGVEGVRTEGTVLGQGARA